MSRTINPQPSIVLGIDPSLTATGWAEHDSGIPEYDYGTIACKKLKGVERLEYMQQQFAHLLLRTRPDLVVYEDYSFGSKFRARATGELGGIFRLWLYKNGYDTLFVSPKALKAFITTNGDASKEDMVSAIKARTGIEGKLSDDEADAIGLAMLGRAYLGQTRVRSKKSKALLSKCVLVKGK